MSIFHLPDPGEGLAEARIVQWHVAAGDDVVAEQLLVSVETAKAVVDIPSPQAGHIVALLAAEGDTIATHSALIEFAGDNVIRQHPGHSSSKKTGKKSTSPIQANETTTENKKTDNGSVVGTLVHTDTIRAESFIIGRHRHTEARLQQSTNRRSSRTGSNNSNKLFSGGEDLDMIRRAMADNLARAHREVVLVTINAEAEIIFEDRRELTARLVRALVAAARAEPALNAWYDADQQKRLLHSAVHVGIAVDSPHGLFVPVLRDAETLGLSAIARNVAELKKYALEHRLSAEQQKGATLTLSNFGALAGRFATPLVTPPQVAIMGAGHAWNSLRPQAGAILPVCLLPLSLSFDHRIVSGGEAARFLDAMVTDLQRHD